MGVTTSRGSWVYKVVGRGYQVVGSCKTHKKGKGITDLEHVSQGSFWAGG